MFKWFANEYPKRQKLMILGLVLCIVHCPAVLACTCLKPQFEVEFEKADYVFQAVVTAIDDVALEETGFVDLEELRRNTDEKTIKAIRELVPTIRVSFEVIRNYKGDPTDLKYLYAYKFAGFCGLNISLDAVGIFIINKSGRLVTCGPSWIGDSHISGFTVDQIEELSMQYMKEHNKSFKGDAVNGAP